MFENAKSAEESLRKSTGINLFEIPLYAAQFAFGIIEYAIANERDLEGDGKYPYSDFLPDKPYLIRFLSNLSNYVITICNIEGILKRIAYDTLCYPSPKPIGALRKNIDDFVDQRSKEIDKYLWYRNKMLAHTSYAAPREETEIIRNTLLYNYSGELINYEEGKGVYVGGIFFSNINNATEKNSFTQKSHDEFMKFIKENMPEKLFMLFEFPKIIEHFNSWGEFIAGKMRDLLIIGDYLDEIKKRTSFNTYSVT